MVDGGYACTDRGGNCSTSYIQILDSVPISVSGTLTGWCTYGVGSGNIALRIFRLNGSNYDYVGGSGTETSGSGLNEFSTSIAVQAGDLVGYYQTGGSLSCETPANENIRYKDYGVDITSTTPTSDWSTSPQYIVSIGVTVAVPDYYVRASGGNDSNSGKSWTDAWATVNKGMSDVPDDKTLHVGFGSYLSEPANNNLSPDAADVTVIYETATTGGGTGTATVEVN